MPYKSKVVNRTKDEEWAEGRKKSSSWERGFWECHKHKASQMGDGKDKERFHLQVFQVFLVFQP